MDDLINADRGFAFQNEERERLMEQLISANRELAFQNENKEKQARELLMANGELAFQNMEREKRALELIIANKELAFQNLEREKRSAELVIANRELVYQNAEKEQLAAELIIANRELAYQNQEKEKRTAELSALNQELLTFTYISNHDLQEPLRKIQVFVSRIFEKDYKNLSETGKSQFHRIQGAAEKMQQYIRDLLLYHYVNNAEYNFEKISLAAIIREVKIDLIDLIEEKKAVIEYDGNCEVDTMFVSFRQLLYNILHNSLKFSKPDEPPHVLITAESVHGSTLKINNAGGKQYCHISIKDNGVGFEPEFSDRIFELFHRKHGSEEYAGTGIVLAIAKKIVLLHDGIVTATSELGKGTTIDIYIPER